jgi:lipoprotein-anchoring transpeptidase ErfK/SrfK
LASATTNDYRNTGFDDLDSRNFRVSGHRIFDLNASVSILSKRFWQAAILTTAGTIGVTSHADAALYYWQDSEPGIYRPAPAPQPRKQRARNPAHSKTQVAKKETGAKPHGPLIIAISINQQKVRVYDANGFFAESPVSTGMKGHATPMGVFSIIQKHKMHHSNIYSGAPMPYMQRITWSGVAMHAGVLPGYPASHGCIRMPMAFAQKMWNWTRMGARVIVTPGEMTPANFSHPLLVAQKVVPQPVIADDPKSDAPAVKSDKGADARSAIQPTPSEMNLELRSTVGHATPHREQTRTADATGAMQTTNAAVTMSDASPSASQVPSSSEAAATSAEVKLEPTATTETKAPEAAAAETKVEAKSDEAPVATSAEVKPDELKLDEVNTGALKAEVINVDPPKADTVRVDEPKPAETPKAAEKPTEPAKTVADAPATDPDAKKDPSRLPGAEKAVVARPDAPKRTGQIAVFVSRKDGKLYVRQNFAPLFEVPVTIAPSERMLGTHVFTAIADKNDPNLLRWSVVSLPVTVRNAAVKEEDERSSRRRKIAGGAPAEAKPVPEPDSPAEALDRITVPPDAMARITEALTTGGSIVVSDQGINQGETGEGTDFIVPLH